MKRATYFLLLASALAFTGCAQYASISEKHPRFVPSPSGLGALASAEQKITQAMRKDRGNPLKAVGEYLDAADTASRLLALDPNDQTARRDYNFALSRIFTSLRDAKIAAWGSPLRVPGAEGEWVLEGRQDITQEPILGKVEFIPADQIELRGSYVSQRWVQAGIGAPLIATLQEGSVILKRDSFAQGPHIYYGVTAIAHFQGRRCVVTFEDPLKADHVTLGRHRMQLAADYTAPLAMMLAKENPKKLEIARLLNPDKYAETARLARLQPYDPAKIPVLFVHGLMDSPATWAPMLNTLRADPAIRARYQFWFFSYPSGYPYPHSAALLRKQLDAIAKRHPGHKKIVLVGHSMGGCISRLMITDSGTKLWMDLLKKPPGDSPFSNQSRQMLSDALIFSHRTDVGRVIFIAAPLRGSEMASNWMGRLGSSLVNSPSTLLHVGEEMRNVVMLDTDSLQLNRIPNSVDTLAPNNRFVRAIQNLPITKGIPYHVICGDRGKGGNKDRTKPTCSDGIVPYWSSHLEGAQSELIVPSGHSAHQNPQAIEEVRRILLSHAH